MAAKKPRITKYHLLKRFKFRADMKKENLYNLSRLTPQVTSGRTYFQQKWTAKSITRAYHAEHVREGQWVRMFTRRPPAVVPMNPRYLARHDGSDEASGRGSGREPLPLWLMREKIDETVQEREPAAREAAINAGRMWEGAERQAWQDDMVKKTTKQLNLKHGNKRMPEQIPYMQMVYHPLERRLDMAVYRSLFASSARQARQFVSHGGVKVNGQLMRYPGYLLNPGDMFQVDPERAMWGIGQNSGKMGHLYKIRIGDMMKLRKNAPEAQTKAPRIYHKVLELDEDEDVDVDDPETAALLEDDSADAKPSSDAEPSSEQEAVGTRKSVLRTLLKSSKELLERAKAKKTIKSSLKRDFRAFIKDLRLSQSKIHTLSDSAVDDLQARFSQLSELLSPPKKLERQSEEAKEDEQAPAKEKKKKAPKNRSTGPRWHPRDWLSPFAFIPRYLEVNHAICSAVYLRHPVCGPGFAEVPTPYGFETGALAFNWYLRRR